MTFSAFTPLAGGRDLGTYNHPNEYPYDLDAGLDYTRPATGISPFPYPLTIGYIQGLVPTFNAQEFQLMQGKGAYGPWTGMAPHTPEQLSWVFPDLMGGLKKVNG